MSIQSQRVITNVVQMADGFADPALFYLPWSAMQWHLYSTDYAPWWLDLSQVAWAKALPAPHLEWYGARLWRVEVSLELMTGTWSVRTPGAKEPFQQFPPVAGYVAGRWPAGAEPVERLWKQWQTAQQNQTLWQEMYGELEPPVLVLHTMLADWADWPVYEKNLIAEWEAWLAWEAEPKSVTSPTSSGGGMQLLLGGDPCSITNAAEAFQILAVATDTNEWITIWWESCSDHLYEVHTTEALELETLWTVRATMIGEDGVTSWTDTNAPAYWPARFYKVSRLPFDGDWDGDGLTNLEEFTAGTDLRNADTDGDGLDDAAEFAAGTNPLAADTDGDGLSDGYEVALGTNPLSATPDPVLAALDDFNYTQVNLLRGLLNLPPVTWNHGANLTARIGQLRGALADIIPLCLDTEVNDDGNLANTNVVVLWTLASVLEAIGSSDSTWAGGSPSMNQVAEVTAVLGKLTHIPAIQPLQPGQANQTWPTNATASVVATFPFAFDRPTNWVSTWTTKTWLHFTETNGFAGAVADDYVTLNETMVAGGENCANLPTDFSYDVTTAWVPGTNTLRLYDGPNCGYPNSVYLSPFQLVHVLQPPVVTISFSKATDCAGWDDWTGKYGSIASRDLQGWLAVPRHGANTVTATVSPSSDLINILEYEPDPGSIATVSPTSATAAAQELTVTGVAAGEAAIHAKIGGIILASFHADVLPLKTNITVALFAITDSLNTNTQPQFVPDSPDLETHLNLVYGKQANVWFSVAPRVVTSFNYNVWYTNNWFELLEGLGRFSPEAKIVQTNTPTPAKLKVYHLRFIRDRHTINALIGGMGFFATKEAFVADSQTCCTMAYPATHEIGHALADLDDVVASIPGSTQRLMHENRLNPEPCRLVRHEWKKVNDMAQP